MLQGHKCGVVPSYDVWRLDSDLVVLDATFGHSSLQRTLDTSNCKNMPDTGSSGGEQHLPQTL